jgi:hypothetical protein
MYLSYNKILYSLLGGSQTVHCRTQSHVAWTFALEGGFVRTLPIAASADGLACWLLIFKSVFQTEK